MRGSCKCGEWEAPITTKELENMLEPYAHHGTGKKRKSKKVAYPRNEWEEYFQCPKCKHRFSVTFSDT